MTTCLKIKALDYPDGARPNRLPHLGYRLTRDFQSVDIAGAEDRPLLTINNRGHLQDHRH